MGGAWMEAFGPGARDFSAPSPDPTMPSGLVLSPRAVEEFDVEVMDTPSWGLWGSGLVLFRRDSSLALQRAGALLAEAAGPSAGGFFWWDLRKSELAERLGEASGIRKIEPVARLRVVARDYEVSNADGKVVFRFVVVCAGGAATQRVFVPRPLRGYGAEAAACCLALGGSDVREGGLLERALADAGVSPHLSSGLLRAEIGPGLPAAEALRRVVSPALETAWKNEEGIIRDTDTEFLHDYRVSLRKARSALGLLSGAFDAAGVSKVRDALGSMAARTNRLRDLDVYLLARREHEDSVPEVLRPAVRGLFDGMSEERAREQAAVASALMAPHHQELKQEISALFDRPDGLKPGLEAEVPIASAVSSRVARRHRKIAKLARELGAEPADAQLHAIRIQCKKLRYLLEFFAAAVPPAAAILEHPLRRLQNRLGAFNDAAVQREFLLDLWQHAGPELSNDRAVALGTLAGLLHAQGAGFRAGAHRALEALVSPSLLKSVRRSLPAPDSFCP